MLGPPGEFGATCSGVPGRRRTWNERHSTVQAGCAEYRYRALVAGGDSGANAPKFEGDKVIAENFDGIYLVRDVAQQPRGGNERQRCCCLAQGVPLGAVMPFVEQQPASLVIANRTRQSARVGCHCLAPQVRCQTSKPAA